MISTRTIILPLITIVAVVPSACVEGSSGTSESGAATGPDGVLGYEWCLEANGANGHYDTFPFLGQIIQHPDTETAIRACICYCPEHNTLMARGMAGTLVGADLTWYNGQVTSFKGLAQGECEDRVAEYEAAEGANILFTLANEEDCEDAVSDEDPYFTNECVQHEDECTIDEPINGTAGEPAEDETAADGGGAFVYGLSDYDDVIDTTKSPPEVDLDFVGEILEDLSVFEDDNIGVTLEESDNSNLGFRLKHLGSDSLPVALGFEEDDVVLTINGISLNSVAGVTWAFELLSQEYDFTVTLDRGTTTVTKSFEFVDMATYP